MRVGRFLEIDTALGTPVRVGARQLVPVARILRINLGRSEVSAGGTFRWIRPIAVEVSDDGVRQRVGIPDWGARAMLAMVGLAAMASILLRTLGRWTSRRP